MRGLRLGFGWSNRKMNCLKRILMKHFEGENKRDEPFMKLNRIDIFQVLRSIRRAVKNVLWTIEVRRATSKSSRLKWKNNAFALGGSLKGRKRKCEAGRGNWREKKRKCDRCWLWWCSSRNKQSADECERQAWSWCGSIVFSFMRFISRRATERLAERKKKENLKSARVDSFTLRTLTARKVDYCTITEEISTE